MRRLSIIAGVVVFFGASNLAYSLPYPNNWYSDLISYRDTLSLDFKFSLELQQNLSLDSKPKQPNS